MKYAVKITSSSNQRNCKDKVEMIGIVDMVRDLVNGEMSDPNYTVRKFLAESGNEDLMDFYEDHSKGYSTRLKIREYNPTIEAELIEGRF